MKDSTLNIVIAGETGQGLVTILILTDQFFADFYRENTDGRKKLRKGDGI
jgi:hypothetical protein